MENNKRVRVLNFAAANSDLVLTFGDFSISVPLNEPPADDEWQLILRFLKREYKNKQNAHGVDEGQK